MASSTSQSLRSSRLLSIDALRGAAAIGVVLYHAVDQSTKSLPQNILIYPVRLIQILSSFGYIGVFLFFVISGFCIHLQWARSQASGQAPEINFGAFWKRRIRRLYPPYIIALILYVLLTMVTVGITPSRFFFYDLGMHLLMLHNLDWKTCYTINGVFWTLAIEEQLYLAYFLLLFLRTRLGWSYTLMICLLARVAWMAFSHVIWLATGLGIPVPEAAASHWFTWALGAIAVESMFGLTTLPKWSRSLSLAGALIVLASVVSYSLPHISKDTPWHNITWFLMHPMWGLGFFIVINRSVSAEQRWTSSLRLPVLVSLFAALGVFSYSIYLTHELVIMQSWQFISYSLSSMQNVFLIVVPAVVLFAWMFFWVFERPYMKKTKSRMVAESRAEATGHYPATPAEARQFAS